MELEASERRILDVAESVVRSANALVFLAALTLLTASAWRAKEVVACMAGRC